MSPQVPNLFEIRRNATDITYSASGIDGKPRLHFDDGERQLDFAGDQLDTEECEIGLMVTAELSFAPDGDTRVLTVVLPHANLPEERADVRIKALVIFTTVRSTIGGPALVHGPLQSYSAKAFRGTARAVAF